MQRLKNFLKKQALSKNARRAYNVIIPQPILINLQLIIVIKQTKQNKISVPSKGGHQGVM